jgi:hypothetical protein
MAQVFTPEERDELVEALKNFRDLLDKMIREVGEQQISDEQIIIDLLDSSEKISSRLDTKTRRRIDCSWFKE